MGGAIRRNLREGGGLSLKIFIAPIFLLGVPIALSACTYGPEQSTAWITDVSAQPGSHNLALSVDFRRFRNATGIAAFPNGGIPKVLESEARIYLCRLDAGVIRQLAAVPEYADIPSGPSVFIEGWNGTDLYFRLHGYERGASGGDDLDRPIRYFYRVSEDDALTRVSALPGDLSEQRNSGPAGAPPFLRYGGGHRDIDIAIDARLSEVRLSEGGVDARVFFPEGSLEPMLEILR
jgi:hypothetical protein